MQRILALLMILAMGFWGANWACSKILLDYAPALIIAFWRIFFVFVASALGILCFRLSFKVDKALFGWLFLASLFNCGFALLFFMGLNFGMAGKGGVLVTTLTPILTYLLIGGFAFYRAKRLKTSFQGFSKSEILGLVLGFLSGLFILNLSVDEIFSQFNLFFVLAALDWALMSLVTSKIKLNALVLSFYFNLLSSLLFTPILLLDGAFVIFQADGIFWLNMFVVAILSTLVGTSIYYYGVHVLGSARANSFFLLVPVFALIFSYFILGEVPSVLMILGTILAIFAIYLINIYAKNKKLKA